jgi:crossover junction endodeoxyribonuclease RuvC
MKYVIGIDPGAKGAVAILDHEGTLIEVWDIPTVEIKSGKTVKKRISPEMFAAELRHWQDAAACFTEKVSAMPGQGVSSMFQFGESLGIIRGIMAGMAIPTTLVTPAVWKRDMKLPIGKEWSRQRAAQMWPKHAREFARVKDDGRAEAALLGLWGLTYSERAAKNR